MNNTPFNNRLNQPQPVNTEKDKFGNLKGPEYDLARDKGFIGHKIAVLHLYTGEGFDFELPRAALAKKGFELIRWKDLPPPADTLKAELELCCQLWLISDATVKLGADHMVVIRDFFSGGKGLYIWGDNEPYLADANLVADAIFKVKLAGDFYGDKVIGLQKRPGASGLLPSHPIAVGIEKLYEGITVASLKGNTSSLLPLIIASNNDLITGCYDNSGCRAIIDGGFTRLFCNWDSAGTARFVVNAAAWLANYKTGEPQQPASLPESAGIIDKFQKKEPTGSSSASPGGIISKF